MKNILALSLSIFLTLSAIAQEKAYFKDEELTKKASEKKANYLKSEFESGDTLISQVSRLSDNFILRERKWISGNPIGTWFQYADNGELISEVAYRKPFPDTYNNASDSLSCENCTSATFMNGEAEFNNFMRYNMRFPTESRELGSTGRLLICFIISKEGEAIPYSILKGVDPYIDVEGWELIGRMPPWQPATKEGEPIDSYMVLPINYNIGKW